MDVRSAATRVRRGWTIALLVAAAATAVVACGGDGGSGGSRSGGSAAVSPTAGGATTEPADPAMPRVTITAEESGDAYTYAGLTDLPAGPVLVELTNKGRLEHQATFARLKDGVTYSQVDEILHGANPTLALALVNLSGGPNAVGPGATGKVVVDLTPGDYYVVCAIPDEQGKPHISHGMVQKVKVTAATSATTPAAKAVPSKGTITLQDFSVILPDGFTGQGWYEVVNEGKQPHEAAAYRLAAGATSADFQAWQAQADAATAGKGAPPSTPPPFTAAGGVAAADPGVTQWVHLDLDPANRYLFVCFIPDVAKGFTPHWMEGMLTPWPSSGAGPGSTSATR
ncbi:MAG: hypothetical protein U0Q07_02550 [Acidimicrobiales bacterium]